ncbi:MAG: ABC transporter permease [Thermomicrobiales bacterium]|jgi:peptide/nickel transport system permease protein|nr:ABC transporter permease [Thermomicrobiales bacterium]
MSSSVLRRRLILIAPQLLFLTILAFVVIRIAPGDPIASRINPATGASLTPEQETQLRAYFHLDEPVLSQYGVWIDRIVHLDFGNSFVTGQPVTSIVFERLGYTMLLMISGFAISLLAIPLGLFAAYRRGSVWDMGASTIGLLGVSVPQFWLSIMAILVGAVWLGVLPAGGSRSGHAEQSALDLAKHLILPALVVGTEQMATLVRFVRSSVIEVLHEDFVRTAKAKGLANRAVMRRHVMKNALLPVITILGMRLPYLVGGAVIVENVFGWPGMGSLTLQASLDRDYPVVMASVLLIGTLTIIGSLLADLAYQLVDPRLRQHG